MYYSLLTPALEKLFTCTREMQEFLYGVYKTTPNKLQKCYIFYPVFWILVVAFYIIHPGCFSQGLSTFSLLLH